MGGHELKDAQLAVETGCNIGWKKSQQKKPPLDVFSSGATQKHCRPEKRGESSRSDEGLGSVCVAACVCCVSVCVGPTWRGVNEHPGAILSAADRQGGGGMGLGRRVSFQRFLLLLLPLLYLCPCSCGLYCQTAEAAEQEAGKSKREDTPMRMHGRAWPPKKV